MKICLISVDETIAMLGVRDLSAVLKQKGFEVKVLSMQGTPGQKVFNEKQLGHLADFIADRELVGVSCMALNKQKAKQVLELARQQGKRTVWGGVYPTLSPRECCEDADYVCVGEGEGFMVDLVTALAKGQPVTGIENLAYWDPTARKCVINPLRPYMTELDAQPFPDHDIEHQSIIVEDEISTIAEFIRREKQQSGRNLYIYLYSSKGCPYSCTYCSNSKLNEIYGFEPKRVRFKSFERVIAELRELHGIYHDFKKVWIMDDSFFTRSAEQLRRFKTEYVKYINLPLDFFIAANMLTEEKLEALLPIDISLIRVGIQSGSANTLKNVYNRPIEIDAIRKAGETLFKINQKHNVTINAVYQIIINNPYETDDDLLQTIKLIQSLKPPFYLSTFFLIFFPGSKLHDRAVADGILNQKPDSSDQEFLAENYENHFSMTTKNLYLNSVLFWMHGRANRHFVGCLPRVLINLLISRPVVKMHRYLSGWVMRYNKYAHAHQITLAEFLDSFTKKTNHF